MLVEFAPSIFSEVPTGIPKAAALSSVATALAATDPDRAERIANSVPDKTRRPRPQIRAHLRQIQALGLDVTITPAA